MKVRFSNAYDGAACGVPAGTYNIYVGSSGGGSSSTGVSISDVRDSLEYKTCTIGGVGTSLQGVSTTCTSSCSSGKKSSVEVVHHQLNRLIKIPRILVSWRYPLRMMQRLDGFVLQPSRVRVNMPPQKALLFVYKIYFC